MCDIFVLSLFFWIVFCVKTISFDFFRHFFRMFSPPIHVFLNLVPSSLPKVNHCSTVIPSILFPAFTRRRILCLHRQPSLYRLLGAQLSQPPQCAATNTKAVQISFFLRKKNPNKLSSAA